MKEKYATKEELEKYAKKEHYHRYADAYHWHFKTAIILIVGFAIIFAFFISFAIIESDDYYRLKGKIDTLTNYTEADCVYAETQWIEDKCNDGVCGNWNVYGYRCSLYCKTYQIPDGQNCKTEEVVNWSSSYFGNYMNSCYLETALNSTLCELTFINSCYASCEKNSANFTAWKNCRSSCEGNWTTQSLVCDVLNNNVTCSMLPMRQKYNQTTCTPKFKTVQGSCITAEDLKTMRGD